MQHISDQRTTGAFSPFTMLYTPNSQDSLLLGAGLLLAGRAAPHFQSRPVPVILCPVSPLKQEHCAHYYDATAYRGGRYLVANAHHARARTRSHRAFHKDALESKGVNYLDATPARTQHEARLPPIALPIEPHRCLAPVACSSPRAPPSLPKQPQTPRRSLPSPLLCSSLGRPASTRRLDASRR